MNQFILILMIIFSFFIYKRILSKSTNERLVSLFSYYLIMIINTSYKERKNIKYLDLIIKEIIKRDDKKMNKIILGLIENLNQEKYYLSFSKKRIERIVKRFREKNISDNEIKTLFIEKDSNLISENELKLFLYENEFHTISNKKIKSYETKALRMKILKDDKIMKAFLEGNISIDKIFDENQKYSFSIKNLFNLLFKYQINLNEIL